MSNEYQWETKDEYDASWFKQVKKFSNTGHGPLPESPVMMTAVEAQFIRKMLNDEMDELDEAINEFWNGGAGAGQNTFIKDHVKVADALIDAIYYLMDCAAKHGFDLDPLFRIIQTANMAKFKNGVKKREDGKILKPADWVDPEPQLIAEMRKQLGKENGHI